MSRGAVPLTVAEVRPETAQARTFVFAQPGDSGGVRIGGHAGQHLVLELVVDGSPVRRAYSLSSSPELDEPPAVTVKRVEGGLASSYLHDEITPGAVIPVHGPAGRFCAMPSPTGYRTFYMFAAGSGITPVMSNLRAILACEPHSVVRLLYGNRRVEDIIFADELDRLAAEHPRRLTVVHALSGRTWRRKTWTDGLRRYRRGIVDGPAIDWFFEAWPPDPQDARYLVCGPPGMIDLVTGVLAARGVPAADVLVERFVAPPEPSAAASSVRGATVVGLLDGSEHRAVLQDGERVLDALRRVGADVPFACQSGVCGSCRARLVDGSVDQGVTFALSADELARGDVLLCQSVPTSERVHVEVRT